MVPRRLGRRTIFFAVISAVCVLLVPAMPSEFRWVAWFSAGLGAFWAVAMAIEDLSAPSPTAETEVPFHPPTPFEPPPPPGRAG